VLDLQKKGESAMAVKPDILNRCFTPPLAAAAPKSRRLRVDPGARHVSLGQGLPRALLAVERVGQQEPERGDGVVVRATLALPLDQSWGDGLLPELQFGDRLRLAGRHVTRYWGVPGKGSLAGYRVATREFSAPTWAEAEDFAWTWLHEEVCRLLVALRRRRQALEQA
jgi:hypothetical protein